MRSIRSSVRAWAAVNFSIAASTRSMRSSVRAWAAVNFSIATSTRSRRSSVRAWAIASLLTASLRSCISTEVAKPVRCSSNTSARMATWSPVNALSNLRFISRNIGSPVPFLLTIIDYRITNNGSTSAFLLLPPAGSWFQIVAKPIRIQEWVEPPKSFPSSSKNAWNDAKYDCNCLPERPLHCPLTTFLVLGRRVTVTALPSDFTRSGLFAATGFDTAK